jgi:hypothetical protein
MISFIGSRILSRPADELVAVARGEAAARCVHGAAVKAPTIIPELRGQTKARALARAAVHPTSRSLPP